ncbi:MAG: lipoprotein-releasing system ATP-binding protein LolD [Spirochaetae bacterium HGW-Spirochaetae-1]|nr:MAG: lipoprotein-releasing system ATP-binding protein LolD [Spirochaetae bacterium HGW-Spirochaetae-1]
MIEAENVEKIYGYGHSALKVLKGVSFSINRGEVVSIVGPSGAGKSTLLNLVGCIDGFQNGTLKILDRYVSHLSVDELSSFRGRHIGFIFQLHNLLPEFTAVENLMMPLLIRREKKKLAREKAMYFLERFNLSDRAHHKPPELSGGECQRVAVARAIIGEPEIILADEPTGSLDSANSQNLTDILLDLGRERNTTIVIVTHDMSIASRTERTISIIDGKIMNPVEHPVPEP